MLLLQRVYGRTIDLHRIFQHKLLSVHLSLADTAGELHHSHKPALGLILEAGISVETLPVSDVNTCTI